VPHSDGGVLERAGSFIAKRASEFLLIDLGERLAWAVVSDTT